MRKNSLEILFEDSDIIVVKKPAGTATQNNRPGTPDLTSLIKNYLYRKPKDSCTVRKEPYLAVIHRLDQPVSGILVFAKTPAAAKFLNKQLTEHSFSKYYKALVTNKPEEDEAILTHYMLKEQQSNSSRICTSDTPGAKKAVLHYQVSNSISQKEQELFSNCKIEDFGSLTLVDIQLETGRHHQIRLQMSAIGCPLWGDSKYGMVEKGTWKNIALCAYQLEFTHPSTKKKMKFTL